MRLMLGGISNPGSGIMNYAAMKELCSYKGINQNLYKSLKRQVNFIIILTVYNTLEVHFNCTFKKLGQCTVHSAATLHSAIEPENV